jgi:glycosyltransferase involved in cell wall biosynthesis
VTASVQPACVIANPGSIPWLAHLASEFASERLLRRYVVSVSDRLPVAQYLLRASGVAPPLAERLRSELAKRRVPPHIDRGAVVHEAAAWEALYVLAWRTRLRENALDALALRRSEAFDSRASRHVEPGDAAVFATQTAALTTLRRARAVGAEAVLDCPIAHYRYGERLLQNELRVAPDYAGTMQFHRFSDRYRRRVDDEVSTATRLVVYTDLVRSTFEEAGVDSGKIVVSALGVDTELFRPGPRADDGVFRIVFVGQVGQRKGIGYLLEAYRRAGIERSELLLVGRLVGDAARHLTCPGVVHHPHVPRWELPDVYRTADVFVLPTLIEGMPQTALEAMACGLPVIVSEHAFGRDVIRDGQDGYVVPIRDSTAIAERLRELHADPDRRASLGHAARRRAEELTWSAFARRICEAVT